MLTTCALLARACACADIGELGMLDDVSAAEERGAPAAAPDEGVFEPFNLDAEREAGDFDEEGNYTERKQEARACRATGREPA